MVSLASLELALEEVQASLARDLPHRIAGPESCGRFAAIRRCVSHREPVIDLRGFADRRFTIGCFYSFILGMVFIARLHAAALSLFRPPAHAVRDRQDHDSDGRRSARDRPVRGLGEKRVNRIWLTGSVTAFSRRVAEQWIHDESDGCGRPVLAPDPARHAILFCLLPTTVLALERQPADLVPGASGLFNLQRNLGGAIGIALVDTIIQQRAPVHAARLLKRLQAGNPERPALSGFRWTAFTTCPWDRSMTQPSPLSHPCRACRPGAFLQRAWLLIGGLSPSHCWPCRCCAGRDRRIYFS